MRTLEAQMRAAGYAADATCLDRMARYFDLLESAGERMNLTAVKGWERVRDELILRSLRLAPVLAEAPADAAVIDIGSGAGVPGLILKIAVPELRVTLVDGTSKKVDFLRQAIDSLELDGTTALHSRAEELAHADAHRGRYDLAVARSVGSLATLAELLLPFVAHGGRAAALKSSGVEEEAADAEYAARVMGGSEAALLPVETPGFPVIDTVVVWRKIAATPGRYPRRSGMPRTRPLLDPERGGRRAKVAAR